MIRKIALTSFSLLWIFIIFAEYLYQHGAYTDALRNFQYIGFLIPLLLGIGGFAYLRYQDKGKTLSYKALNGLGLFGLTYLMVLIITAIFFSKYEGADFTPAGAGHLTIYYAGTALATYLCVGFAYLIGDLLLILFPMKMAPRELMVTKIALGIMVLVTILFLLGTLNLLYPFVIIPLFLGVLLLNRGGGKDFVQKTLLKPIRLSPQLNLLGIASFAVVLVFVTLNFTQVARPIAIGFDAMTLYMRIPSLIGDYHGLVDGHGIYNWSLFMSMGFVVFDSTAVTLALSFIGGPLALFALYALARRWMNTNLALLVLALFYTMPQINFLSYQDMKIDLGLLFISLSCLILLVNWINPMKTAESVQEAGSSGQEEPKTRNPKLKSRNTKPKSRNTKPKKKKSSEWAWLQTPAFLLRLRDAIEKKSPKILQNQGMMVWLGLLVGFAFGIKITSVMLLMGVLAVIWYIKGNAWSALAVMLLCIFGIFLLGLDKQSGTRSLHSSVEFTRWILGAAGMGMLTWQTFKNRQEMLANVKRSLVMIFFFVVVISPWFVKNYSERRQVSVDALLNGKSASPTFRTIDFRDFKQNGN